MYFFFLFATELQNNLRPFPPSDILSLWFTYKALQKQLGIRCDCHVAWLGGVNVCCYVNAIPLLVVVSWRDPGRRPPRHGHVRNVRPVRKGVPAARQEEEIWDQSAQKNAKPCLQWDFCIQGRLECDLRNIAASWQVDVMKHCTRTRRNDYVCVVECFVLRCQSEKKAVCSVYTELNAKSQSETKVST